MSWAGGENLRWMPCRYLPDASQFSPIISDASQMLPRCLSNASQMLPQWEDVPINEMSTGASQMPTRALLNKLLHMINKQNLVRGLELVSFYFVLVCIRWHVLHFTRAIWEFDRNLNTNKANTFKLQTTLCFKVVSIQVLDHKWQQISQEQLIPMNEQQHNTLLNTWHTCLKSVEYHPCFVNASDPTNLTSCKPVLVC